MQDPLVLIEPIELYNLLNQVYLGVPCLVREHSTVLFDTRKSQDYNESHIITAKHVPYTDAQGYLLPKNMDYTAMEHIIVMDSRTSSLKDISSSGTACARHIYTKLGSKSPVKVVSGGFERFSALYPFLRSSKILFTQREMYLIKIYPIEVEQRFLYNGTLEQAADPLVAKHLKIKAHINTTTVVDPLFSSSDVISGGNNELVPQLLNVPLEDDIKADAFQHFPVVCSFIEQHKKEDGKSVLIYSDNGVSRSVVFLLAYLINKSKVPLKEAIGHVMKCHHSICPNRTFIKDLLRWEVQVLGSQLSKPSDLGFLSYE